MKTKFYFLMVFVLSLTNDLIAQTNKFPTTGAAGIGTTAPNASSLLEVKSTTKGVLIPRMTQVQRNAIVSPATGLLIFQTDGTPGFYYYSGTSWTAILQTTWSRTGNAGTNSNVNFIGTTDAMGLTFRTNNKEAMRINYLGRVGIGTNTPAAILNVNSSDYVSLTTPGMLMLGNVTGSNMVMDYNVIQARSNGIASSLFLNYYGGNTYLGASARVAISSTGTLTTSQVGINGSANASYGLTVNASSSYHGIYVTDGGSTYSLYTTKSGSLAGIYAEKTSTSSYDACVWGHSTGSAYGIEGNSGTGIGILGTTGNTASYAGYFSGNIYTTGSYLPSDLTLKKDVKDFTKAIDIINQLHPKIYLYKDDENFKSMNLPKGDRYGLIAEDVEKVLPGLVKQTKFETVRDESRKNGVSSSAIEFKALNYTELIPIIIKGMQEQDALIQKQQQLMQKQELQMQQQQKQIDELKNMVTALTGKTGISDAAKGSSLQQNAPNPFNQNTTIQFSVSSSAKQAQLMIYDQSGRLVRSFSLGTGESQVTIDKGSLPGGNYAYTLMVDGKKVDTKNMILAK
jgi:hypothetical protein